VLYRNVKVVFTVFLPWVVRSPQVPSLLDLTRILSRRVCRAFSRLRRRSCHYGHLRHSGWGAEDPTHTTDSAGPVWEPREPRLENFIIFVDEIPAGIEPGTSRSNISIHSAALH